MADVEKDVVQEFVRLYQRIVSNPLFVTIWDDAAAARQGLEQLRSGNTPFVLPGNAWTGTSGRASSNRYVVGKIFSELREKCECLTFEARFRALNQIRAWLGRRVEALHKNQARRERVHRLT